ncbi:MAG TPA: zeta toxin family protein [Gemmataceae bacterium]|jgi:predicted ABC-type ATPase|nr:zeta toxin family protein [Gemmataceae bacterium]
MSHTPKLVVLAGPNGAGKTTAANRLIRDVLGVEHFVNADEIAKGLSAFRTGDVAIGAGRLMLNRLNELSSERSSFAFETTLASRTFAPWIHERIRDGYAFHLIFLWLPRVDMAIERVAHRIREGGHAVPEETVRRRYEAGLRNFFELYRPLTTRWSFYDNSTDKKSRRIAVGHGTTTTRIIDRKTWNLVESEWGNAGS